MKQKPIEPGRVRLGIQLVHVEVEGKFVSGMQITCTDCGATDTIVTNKNAASLPDQVIIKKFQQKGWEFRSGNTRRYCPSCVALKHKRGPRPVGDVETKVMIAAISPVLENLQNPKTSKTIVPAVMEFDRGPSPVHTFRPPAMTTEQRRQASMLIAEAAGKLLPPEAITPPEVIHNMHKEAIVPETNVRSLAEIGKVTDPDAPTKRRIFRAIDDNWDESRSRYLGNHSDQFIAEDLNVPRIWVEKVRIENFGGTGDNQELHDFKVELDGKIADVAKLNDGALHLATKYEDALKSLKDLRRRLERIETSILPRR